MEGKNQAEVVEAVINNAVTPIMLQIIRDFEDFDIYQDELERSCEENLTILEKINEDDTHNILIDALESIDSYIMCDKEEANVIELQKETDRKKQMKNELESKIANNKKALEKQKKDLQKVEADPKLQTMRDTVQAWKLATRIHFVYEGTSDECGYGIGPTGKMKPFSFNPEKTTQREITNALYEVMNSSK